MTELHHYKVITQAPRILFFSIGELQDDLRYAFSTVIADSYWAYYTPDTVLSALMY